MLHVWLNKTSSHNFCFGVRHSWLRVLYRRRRWIAPSSIKENEQSANFGTEREERDRETEEEVDHSEGFFAESEKEEGVSDRDWIPSRYICFMMIRDLREYGP